MKKNITLNILLFLFVSNFCFAQLFNNRIPYRLKNKWGLCDTNVKIIAQPIYDEVEIENYSSFLDKNLCQVKLLGKYGLIDNNGNKVINPVYEKIILRSSHEYPFYKINGVIVKQNGKYGFSDFKNKIKIPCEYDTLYIINMLVNKEYEYHFIGMKNTNYFNFNKDFIKTATTKEKIDAVNVETRMEGVMQDALMYPYSEKKMLDIIEKLKISYAGVFDSISILKIPDSQMLKFYSKGKFCLANAAWASTQMTNDTNNSVFVDKVIGFKVNCYLVQRNGKLSAIYEDGNLLIPFEYSSYKNWNYRMLFFTKNKKVGMKHFYLPLTIEAIYDDIEEISFQDYTLWKVTNNGKYGYINNAKKKYYQD